MVHLAILSTLLTACQPRPQLQPIDAFAPPVVGITVTVEGQNTAIAAALERAGAEPRFLLPDRSGDPLEIVEGLDAVVLGGGADIDPRRYGEPADPSVNHEAAPRQQLDFGLAAAAMDRDLPLLGVCLGAQIMAVHRGGSLIQDIPSERPDALDHYAAHSVAIVPGTPLAGLYPEEEIRVSSLHHQAMDGLPAGLELAAQAPDGVIEAFWDPELSWALGLQYHPERDATDQDLHAALWTDLVEHARQRRRNRPGARQSE
jgi:putative glutamine amidotransferase